ncbi:MULTISPECIES: class D beta-lactamase [unclassified Pseudomonas]|uniref:class D beta-lactamase n=1 Tax=unclassified Pseudomonas TaxID=196821 RepID=UPI0025E9208A|nr:MULTISPECIES: class D beta-lactamase [unclassified Pseudomonas]
MWIYKSLVVIGLLGSLLPRAQAAPVCTLVSNVKTGVILQQVGTCSQRVTLASTFKLAISLMGFDSGFLQDKHTPVLEYKAGEPDWGGANWRQPTDPARWIKYSVVWYSGRITHALGALRVEKYARSFEFGNADLSGDPGKSNGLDRAWISSSLKISPLEQLRFQEKLARGDLPVSAKALAMTSHIFLVDARPEGWEIHGKTGTAFPRNADGVSDEAHGYGWFVGWAKKGDRVLAFVQLEQDDEPHSVAAGVRVRDKFLSEFPQLAQ